MSYIVKHIRTKPNVSVLEPYTWISNLPGDYLAALTDSDGPFPNQAGQTPKQIVDESKSKSAEHMKNNGLISTTVHQSEDGLVKTIEYEWVSKEAYTDNLRFWNLTTANKYLFDRYLAENNVTLQIVEPDA